MSEVGFAKDFSNLIDWQLLLVALCFQN